MNEKCPMPGCDGDIGFQSFYIGGEGSAVPIFLECSECGFRCNRDHLESIAAAMELAKAFTAADALGEFSYDLYTAQLRVLEVFGGE